MERFTKKDCEGYSVEILSGIRKATYCDEDGRNAYDLFEGEAINKLGQYEDLEEQGKLLKLKTETVWFICDKNTKYAMVMSKSIRDLKVYEFEGIDKKGYYWSSKESAESALKEMSE